MGCPRRILDKPAIPRTIEWFVSARGRMRAPAGAHYARARVYRRPRARARYVVLGPKGPRGLPLLLVRDPSNITGAAVQGLGLART